MSGTLIFPLLVYFVLLLLFFNSQTLLMYWVFLEMNLVSFLVLVLFLDKKDKEVNMNQYLYYFAIQSMGSFVFLASILTNFGSSDLMVSSSLFVVSMILKSGLFPLHSWVYSIVKEMGKYPLFLLLTLQKIPIMLMLFMLPNDFLFIILLMSMGLGSYYIFISVSIKEMLVSSSVYTTLWFFCCFIFSPFFFLFMFFNYCIFLFKFIFSALESFPLGFMGFSSYLFMGFLMGLPPFNIFFLKIYSLAILKDLFSYWLMSFFWLFAFLSVLGYFKFLWSSLFFHHSSFKYTFYQPFSMILMIFYMSSVLLLA